jgi:superfamily II DNA or RNA helicase
MTDKMIRLRPYQNTAITAVEKAIKEGAQRPAVILPTGAGKTVIFAYLAARHVENHGTPVLILVHREELVLQTIEKLRMIAPDLNTGVIKAEQNETDADVIVGSVQTLCNVRRLNQIVRTPGLGIVDECHHASAASYQTIMSWFDCPFVGFTATMIRGDGKDLGETWTLPAVFSMDILDMIPDFLVDPVGRQVTVDGLTLGQVAMRGRDFAPMSLGDALRTAEAGRFITDSYREYAADMPGIVFAPDVATVMDLTESFNDAGIPAAPVWGDMDRTLRRNVLREYEAGRIQVLISCMVLTEGFDSPRAQCAVIARPTTNPGLYVQMVGRVLRPYPGKTRALVLDVVGASSEFSLAGLEDLTGRRVCDIEPGESLLEAVQRERRRRNPKLADYVVNVREVDLFHRSKIGWLETHAGIWFLDVPRGLIFLWPDKLEPGLYRVGTVPAYPDARPTWHVEGATIEYAMVWAEALADDYLRDLGDRVTELDPYGEQAGFWSLSRTASWRRRPATPLQIDLAEKLNVDLQPFKQGPGKGWFKIDRGRISDLIGIEKASAVLDVRVRRLNR